MAMITSLVLAFISGSYLITYLKKYKISQSIRSDGPPTHLAKTGTPTMGGLAILFSMVTSTLLWARLDNRFIILALISTLWLGLIGFWDDGLGEGDLSLHIENVKIKNSALWFNKTSGAIVANLQFGLLIGNLKLGLERTEPGL